MELGGGWGPASTGGWGHGFGGVRWGIGLRRGLVGAWVLVALLVIQVPGAAAQSLSLEAAEQLLSQAFAALNPAPAWEGRLRLGADAQVWFDATAMGVERLRLAESDGSGRVHVWNQGYTYVGTGASGRLGASTALLSAYREALLPFLFLEQVARDPVVGVELREGTWSLQVRDRSLGLLWIDVRAGLPARIRQAEDGTVLWETAGPGESGALRVRFSLPGQPAVDLVLERLSTGWVSRAASGSLWLDRRPIEAPDEALFRPGLLGEFLGALDRFEAARGQGQTSDARAALRHAIRLDPYRTSLYSQLGVLEVEIGNWQGALAAFDQAFQLDPEDPLLANNLAYVLIDTGIDPHRGVALAEQAVERQPLEASFLDTLGWGYVQIGRLQEGAEILRQARELAATRAPSTRAEIAYHLAAGLARLGQTDEALRLLEEVLELDPNRSEARTLHEELTRHGA